MKVKPILYGTVLLPVLLTLCLPLPGVSQAASPPGEQPPPADLADSLQAWSPLDTIFALPPMVIEGQQPAQVEIEELVSLATSIIIPSEHAKRTATTNELLHELPGLEVRQYGGLGAFSTASLRGSGGQEVAVYLDGVDLRNPFTGMALLDELPLVGADRIEVYRGGVPGELGGGALSGAIQVVTGGDRYRRLSLRSGRYGQWRTALELNGRGPWGTNLFISAALQGSENDFKYLDLADATPYNTDDDSLKVQQNAHYRARDLLATMNWEPSERGFPGQLSLFYRYLFRENGIPGTSTLPVKHAFSRRDCHDTRLTWRSPLLASRLRVRARGYLRAGWNRFFNPENELLVAMSGDETRDRLHTHGLQLHSDLYLLPLHILVRGERRSDFILPDNLNPRKPEEFERSRKTRRVETETRLMLFDDRLLLQAGYGEEWLEDNYHNYVNPLIPWTEHDTHAVFRNMGFNSRLLDRLLPPGRCVLNLRAKTDDGYRAPSLLELFGQDVSIIGNPQLVPERGRQWDIGLGLRCERPGFSLRLEVTHFDRDLDHQIIFIRNSQHRVNALNVAASEITGNEISLKAGLELGRMDWWLSWADTRQEAIDHSGRSAYDGKTLPYCTPHASFARLGCDLSRFSFHVDVNARARTYAEPYNMDERALPASTLWGAGVAWRSNRYFELSIEGLNLNNDGTQDILGYPLPGRTWRIGLNWTDRASEDN
ncbi:MAG: TonB-dependent receptor [bacterium]|nr:TonB-dependent receptor [bacterium]